MGSTFGGFEIAKRGLTAHQLSLNTTGHNISNADNPLFARQRVTMESMDPLYEPSLNRAAGPGQIGQGVSVAQVERIRDSFYDDQISEAENVKGNHEVAQQYLLQMERIFNEPSDNTLRFLSDKFWASWQDLANFPSDMSHREVVLERGNALVTRVNDIYNKLDQIRIRANNEVVTSVQQINTLGAEIRELNERILKSQAFGDNPNDLMDRRDAAIEKLSGIVDIRIGRGDRDEIFVFIGEQALVQGEIHRELKTDADPKNEGMARIFWAHNDKDVLIKGGRLFGLVEMRDRAIAERIDQLDLFAVNVADIVNEIHRDGFGINGKTDIGFFEIRNLSARTDGSFQMQNASGNFDLNQDGSAEVTSLFRVTGANTVDPDRRLGIEGTLTFHRNDSANTEIRIDYRADETLKEIIKKINDSGAGVAAYMTHDAQLALKGDTAEDDRKSNFMIRHMEDSGELLVGFAGILNASGRAGAFDFRRVNEISKLRPPFEDMTLTPIYHPAAQMRLSESVLQDPASIAAGRGKDEFGAGDYTRAGGMQDGTNALLIASALKQDSKMIGHHLNPEEFYNALISKLGTQSRAAEDAAQNQKDNIVFLNKMRQSIMGVNLDEEMSNMVQFQHSYNAAAKMLQTQNEMLDVILKLGA
jgi:flagellar hook-associated protein 1 FlgK